MEVDLIFRSNLGLTLGLTLRSNFICDLCDLRINSDFRSRSFDLFPPTLVGAGLCDGEGERAYTGYAPHIRNVSANVFNLRRFGIFFFAETSAAMSLPKRTGSFHIETRGGASALSFFCNSFFPDPRSNESLIFELSLVLQNLLCLVAMSGRQRLGWVLRSQFMRSISL